MKIEPLRKRSQFIKVNECRNRVSAKSLVLQLCQNETNSPDTIRLGFTVTKKLGNAVVRNRIKRRLRAAAKMVMPNLAQPSFDYVLIGRSATFDRDFKDIIKDLKYALHTAKNLK